jgi:hypothetical protein
MPQHVSTTFNYMGFVHAMRDLVRLQCYMGPGPCQEEGDHRNSYYIAFNSRRLYSTLPVKFLLITAQARTGPGPAPKVLPGSREMHYIKNCRALKPGTLCLPCDSLLRGLRPAYA